MALIKCKECGHLVSDQAVACPNCGCPASSANDGMPVVRWQPEPAVEEPVYYYERSNKDNIRKWLIGIIVALVVVLVCGGMYYYSLVSERQRLDREKFVADSIAKAKNDSVIAAEKAEQEHADSLELARLKAEERRRKEQQEMLGEYEVVTYEEEILYDETHCLSSVEIKNVNGTIHLIFHFVPRWSESDYDNLDYDVKDADEYHVNGTTITWKDLFINMEKMLDGTMIYKNGKITGTVTPRYYDILGGYWYKGETEKFTLKKRN